MNSITITAHQYALAVQALDIERAEYHILTVQGARSALLDQAQACIDYATARLEWMRREMAAQSR
jgi:hypothetical protein